MRGFSDQNGHSPFWDSLGYLFFDMDFAAADYLSGVGQKSVYRRTHAEISSLC